MNTVASFMKIKLLIFLCFSEKSQPFDPQPEAQL